MAATRFLLRYQDPTRAGYTLSLKQWFQFCEDHDVRPLQVERAHVELWIRALEQKGNMASTINGKVNAVVGFYKLAKIDRLDRGRSHGAPAPSESAEHKQASGPHPRRGSADAGHGAAGVVPRSRPRLRAALHRRSDR
jgi:hypothetical protein